MTAINKKGRPRAVENILIIEHIKKIADGSLTSNEIANIVGSTPKYVQRILLENDLQRFQPGKTKTKLQRRPENILIIDKIKQLADGFLTSKQIAESVGSNQKYVQRIMLLFDLPRLPQRSPMYFDKNPSWVGGRMIDLAGYVLVNAPENHPYSRYGNVILEHRLILEDKIGRYLLPSEVVDHIDGITIHNHPDNLRLFDCNSDHLKATISGQIPNWSQKGFENMQAKKDCRKNLTKIDTYNLRRKNGDVRLQMILRAWLSLDKDSPYLLGTHHWLEKAEIVDFSRSNLQQHLDKLNQQYT